MNETISLFGDTTTERWVSSTESPVIFSPIQLATDGVVRTKPHPQNPRWSVYNQTDLLAQKLERHPDDVQDNGRHRRRPTRRPTTVIVETRDDRHILATLVARIDQLEAGANALRYELATLRSSAD